MKTESIYKVGTTWYHSFGNGFMKDTIIKVVDNFRVELAGHGIVQKSWVGRHWFKYS